VEALKFLVAKLVVVPDAPVHVGVVAVQLVDFCQAIVVPLEFSNVKVVPVPAHTVDNPVTVPAVAVGVIVTTKLGVVAALVLQVPEVTTALKAVETLKFLVAKLVVVPVAAVHVGVVAVQLVDFCQAIVPIAFAKVKVVPVPEHTVDNPVTVPAIAVGITEY
jgi:hypothetical protein